MPHSERPSGAKADTKYIDSTCSSVPLALANLDLGENPGGAIFPKRAVRKEGAFISVRARSVVTRVDDRSSASHKAPCRPLSALRIKDVQCPLVFPRRPRFVLGIKAKWKQRRNEGRGGISPTAQYLSSGGHLERFSVDKRRGDERRRDSAERGIKWLNLMNRKKEDLRLGRNRGHVISSGGFFDEGNKIPVDNNKKVKVLFRQPSWTPTKNAPLS